MQIKISRVAGEASDAWQEGRCLLEKTHRSTHAHVLKLACMPQLESGMRFVIQFLYVNSTNRHPTVLHRTRPGDMRGCRRRVTCLMGDSLRDRLGIVTEYRHGSGPFYLPGGGSGRVE
ncbi:hypothetical protein EVAR_30577_1 [Eumeta japonica]|uniref:Uncharacterized protein n=1 Tax=Eumeta variegata TaxID=151549 RepID=A0A4C1VN38_EUMVA|nr:hypothetical protein EVAR_30577_1 [Eumeta japonica]